MKKVLFIIGFAIAGMLYGACPVFAYQSPGKPSGLVNDFAQILSTTERDSLAGKLVDFGKTTGNAIVVVTVKDLGGDDINNFATKLFKEWGIGSAKSVGTSAAGTANQRDNGLLILISRDDRKIRIEPGYGLEPVITDALSSSIIRNIMTPAFQAGRYYDGVDSAVDTIIGTISGNPEYVKAVEQQSGSKISLESWFYWIVFIFIYLASILGRSKSWWLGGVLGGVAGVIIGFIFGFIYIGVVSVVGLGLLGLLFDFIISSVYAKHSSGGTRPPWWIGGGGFGNGHGGSGGFGGGFGGFGGGRSGGGGASGSW